MKWIDYREKLGLSFNESEKFEYLKNRILNFVELLGQNNSFYLSDSCYRWYAITIGEYDTYYNRSALYQITNSFSDTSDIRELIARYIAFYNVYTAHRSPQYPDFSNALLKFLKDSLTSANISFETFEDKDGVFIFPKGAKELDDALVSVPLEWLTAYPKSHSAFVKALKEYAEANATNASDIADKFRKALETFFQEFFGGGRSLEKYLSDHTYERYLNEHGIPAELRNELQNTVSAYSKFMNGNAKHHDKTQPNVLEYIMYQTGNIIRLLITLKQEEGHPTH